MNILLLIGLILLLGTVSGKIFSKLKLPEVTGYIIAGLFLGETFRGILSSGMTDSLRPFLSVALGIIGFMIGAEIHFERFKRYSKSIYTILVVEAFLTFALVCVVTVLITGKIYVGLILGALASATAPAATYSVLGQYKARGPVTMTTLSIVALDDALALLIYGFASAFARSLIFHETPSLFRTMGQPLFQIAISVLIGALAGLALHLVAIKTRDRDRFLPFPIGFIILVVGICVHLDVDPILASMVLGGVASNMQSLENRDMFDLVKKFSPPMFVLFFVLVGARLDARILSQGGVLILAIAYIVSRSIGKVAGAYIGGKLSGAKDTVTKYLGFCLFDQAGVAVGLAIATYSSFSLISPEARSAGVLILSIITATTFILQLVSPAMIKYGISKADEVNRDVTEEDVIKAHKVSDMMGMDFFVIKENNTLYEIMNIMKKSESYHFPVVSMNGDFIGVISLGEIRETFYEDQLGQLILAGDLVKEQEVLAYADQPLADVIKLFRRKNIDYLPVMENNGNRRLVGELEQGKLDDLITKEVLLRKQELEN